MNMLTVDIDLYHVDLRLESGQTMTQSYKMTIDFKLEELWREIEFAMKLSQVSFISVYTVKRINPGNDVRFVLHEWDRHRKRLYSSS